MATGYFSNFPKINYFNVYTTNITLRAAFIDKLKQEASVFYPYVVKDGESADDIASWYYDRPDFDWLVYLANDIVDPHSQWPKSYQELEDYIAKKYGSVVAAKSNIEFYRKKPEIAYISVDGADFSSTDTDMVEVEYNDDIRITPYTYSIIDDQINYVPVYTYDYEVELNEQKRNITLIDNKLKNRVAIELSDLLNV